MRKLLLTLGLFFLLGFCKIHLGEGQLNLWVQTTSPPFSVDYAKVNIIKVSLHFVGHYDVDLEMEPVEVAFLSGAEAQLVGTFLLNTGSYDKLNIEFGGATLGMGGLDYEVEITEPRVSVPVKLEVSKETPVVLRVFIDGSSFSYSGEGKFTFTPVVYATVE